MTEPYYSDDHVTIYHGDSRDVLASIEVEPDLVVTDPPYAISVDGEIVRPPGQGVRRLNFFDGDADWDAMTLVVLETLALSVRSEKTLAIYVWCGHRQFGQIINLLESMGFSTRFLVWSKSCPAPSPPGVGWPSGAELCVYAWRKGRPWTWSTGSGPRSNVIIADSYRHGQPGKVAHPTQKPLPTMSLPIESSSPVGGLILDPFMGSGTTLRAAKNIGRRAIGIELEERYCEIAANRCAQEVLAL